MTDFSYPKTKRLLKPDQFKVVFNQPKFKVHQTHLMAFARSIESDDMSSVRGARLGMAITKKKLPTAVARNRVKRIIREEFRHTHAMLPALDIVFILKRPTNELTNEALKQQVVEILRQIISKASRQPKV